MGQVQTVHHDCEDELHIKEISQKNVSDLKPSWWQNYIHGTPVASETYCLFADFRQPQTSS